jgi:hypothetical protein
METYASGQEKAAPSRLSPPPGLGFGVSDRVKMESSSCGLHATVLNPATDRTASTRQEDVVNSNSLPAVSAFVQTSYISSMPAVANAFHEADMVTVGSLSSNGTSGYSAGRDGFQGSCGVEVTVSWTLFDAN